MVTDSERAYFQMAIVWGGKSFFAKTMDHATDKVLTQLKSAGNIGKGDAVVVASGAQPGVIGGTNKVGHPRRRLTNYCLLVTKPGLELGFVLW
jgi:pyruvate kinase